MFKKAIKQLRWNFKYLKFMQFLTSFVFWRKPIKKGDLIQCLGYGYPHWRNATFICTMLFPNGDIGIQNSIRVSGKDFKLLSPFMKYCFKLRAKYSKNVKTYLKYAIRLHWLADDLEPLVCPFCDNSNTMYFKEVVTDTIEGTIMEKNKICMKCNCIIGTWCTGHWTL